MGLFDRLFTSTEPDQGPTDVRFGRYSDAYKEDIQYDLWDQSLDLFDEGAYLESYIMFLRYLRDEDEDNVRYSTDNGTLHFEVIQGSKRLEGFLRNNEIRAAIKVAKVRELNSNLLESILRYNFNLRYCRFALTEDNYLNIIFDSTTLDGSPYKLYYAFKEAASHADKQDDMLIYRFDCVEHTDKDLFYPIAEFRKDVKLKYLKREISRLLERIEQSTDYISEHAGGTAYMLLSLAYKLDYLIKPEGYLMDRLEAINTIYFSNDISATSEKIDRIIEEYKAVLARGDDQLKEEMYRVKSTFGITVPVNQDRIVNFIEGELGNMDWYLENELIDIAQSIPEYIIGYVLFHFAPPLPVLELLQLYLRITETKYFENIGFSRTYLKEDGLLDRNAIKRAISNIVERNDHLYPFLIPNFSQLKYGNKALFAKSYLQMIYKLDLAKKG